MTSSFDKLALVIGAHGAFGSHTAHALIGRGWRIRALARDPGAARAKMGERTPIDWVKGDAMDGPCVAAAAEGARVIVHAANPPGYRDWPRLVLPMIDNTIAAARRHGGRIVLPGNVYNFAPDAGPRIAEDATQSPVTRKGKIRAQLERRLASAAGEGVKTLIVRAGDFFGPAAPTSSLAWLVHRRKGEARALLFPGPPGVKHAFAYLPDLAQSVARLVEREDELGKFAVFHFAGNFVDRDQLAAEIRRASGRPDLPAWPFPWALMWAAAPFSTTMREMIEMQYLWKRPIGLDGGKLEAFLGGAPTTPIEQALRVTLADLREAEAPNANAGEASWTMFDWATRA